MFILEPKWGCVLRGHRNYDPVAPATRRSLMLSQFKTHLYNENVAIAMATRSYQQGRDTKFARSLHTSLHHMLHQSCLCSMQLGGLWIEGTSICRI